MASAIVEETVPETPIERSEAIPIEPPSKLTGRARLLQGLQRISSSPSIAQMGRKRAVSNPYNARGTSLSCVSLNAGASSASTSPRNYDGSYSSQSSGGGFSTAPTSVFGTPGDTPFINNIPNRPVGNLTPGTCTPTSTLPLEMRPQSRNGLTGFPEYSMIPELVEDYFSLPISTPKPIRKPNFNFWRDMPHELKLQIFAFLRPRELVRASVVSKDFHKMCFDGQLWTSFDASEFYSIIPAEALSRIIVTAGPFVRELNLRGCLQIEHYKRAEVVVKACRNLITATLEGCRNFQRQSLHSLLKSNQCLANLNLTGLNAVTNATCKIIATSCPHLETFNVSWCNHMDARGIKAVLLGCPKLKDLRAGEVKGFDNLDVAQDIFETNSLEKLILPGCSDITDQALQIMIHGENPEIDILTGLPIVPVRKLRHLNLSRCNRLTSAGVDRLAHQVPELEGLQLSGCTLLTNNALSELLDTAPKLTHLDIEELAELTNNLLSEHLAKAPCAPNLQHLSVSYCENLGDIGMLPVIRACVNLRSIDMDNTKISDLVLAEAAAMVRNRSPRTTNSLSRPRIGLRMVVFDCQNITWTGIREVMSRNSEIKRPTKTQSLIITTYPTEIISLKCFYGWQPTITEHTRRVLAGDLPAAARLERKWTEWMMANEEAGAAGAGMRRRRRRAREAQMLHADEEEGGVGMLGIGRRRRARSNGCQIM